MTRRGSGARRRIGGVLAAAVLVLAAGCSSVPASGSAEVVRTVQGTQSPSEPLQPQSGQAPDQVIRGFIEASADNRFDLAQGKGFAAARPFLTPKAAGEWQAARQQIVVVRDEYSLSAAKQDPNTFVLAAQLVGTLAVDKSFAAASGTVQNLTFHVVEENGEWRIDAPPKSIVLTTSDFSGNYLERPIYFLNSAGTTLVPDLRYLPRSASEAVRADRLVNLLLAGPSAKIAGSVTSLLSGGVGLASNVVTDDAGVVLVDLTGVTLATDRARQALAAQLSWTVRAEGSVSITLDGAALDPDHPEQVYSAATTGSFDPDTTPATGHTAVRDSYYLDSSGRIVSIVDGTAMWGEWGVRGGVQSAAMSASTAAVAAVVRSGTSVQLRIGHPLARTEGEATVLTAQSMTQPSWDRFGNEVWVVQDGATDPQVIRLTTAGQVSQQVVTVTGLDKLGAITSLRLSPDGVRVAVVADGALYIGSVVRSTLDGTTRVRIDRLAELNPDLRDVGPIVFQSATELLIGALGSDETGYRIPVSVSVDGRSVTPRTDQGIFGDITAIAVDDDNTYIAFGGRIWSLDGSLTSGVWRSPDPKAQSFYGSSPFLPS